MHPMGMLQNLQALQVQGGSGHLRELGFASRGFNLRKLYGKDNEKSATEQQLCISPSILLDEFCRLCTWDGSNQIFKSIFWGLSKMRGAPKRNELIFSKLYYYNCDELQDVVSVICRVRRGCIVLPYPLVKFLKT